METSGGGCCPVASIVTARSQLEAIRDEWLAPLVAQITEIARLVQSRRRLVESERKRAVELGTIMTSQQAMMAFSRLFQVIKANVHDRAVLQLITNVFYELDAESRGAPASNPERYDA